MEKEQMNEKVKQVRAQYCSRKNSMPQVGNRDIFDVYVILLATKVHISGEHIAIPFNWINKCGGYGPLTVEIVNNLSNYIKLVSFQNNPAAKSIMGLTDAGITFIKSFSSDLKDELKIFNLSENIIKELVAVEENCIKTGEDCAFNGESKE